MLVPKALLGFLVLGFTMLAIGNSSFAETPDLCKEALPESLSRKINLDYPGWKIVTHQDLGGWEKKFSQDYKGGCPGVATANFYGDGRKVHGLVLFRKVESEIKSVLLLAQRRETTQWEIIQLLGEENGCACPIVTAPAGEYLNVYGEKSLNSKGEVFVHFQYEAWAIVFAWTGIRIEQTHIQD